ncbi:class I SAM-dependent methyltransferase [Pullulanibacillus sp. KACC 23026]|uniref:class I SAM-dependent methyltransferase n=1 Tax=Pullulanibacillus sp. KACC 23026 TaxID=3028315 RepID=UPI0023AECE7B|nr:class I SAM-dependent methyltransferase [Pullulanibacillus sp. KACC 23026]WEG13193.1 class I SAM-dependent methyltransferase [Pullulanibacillus sp. KACC 23026]
MPGDVNLNWRKALLQVTDRLDEAAITYMFIGEAALLACGAEPPSGQPLECEFQWDQLEEAHQLFLPFGAGPVTKTETGAQFTAIVAGSHLLFWCQWNHVVLTDPARMVQEFSGKKVFVEAPTAIIHRTKETEPEFRLAKAFLSRLQSQNTAISLNAWNTGTYEAWVNRFGNPVQLGEAIRKQPEKRLVTVSHYLGNLTGKKVFNLMGSNAIKGVAMACLGATVTVLDLSEESGTYARELAEAAGVSLTYIVGDVLETEQLPSEGADRILMERGILHYFVDLQPLMTRVAAWLADGGRFVLQDFHPISTKLIQSKGKKHLVNGNYFDPAMHPSAVATSKYTDQNETSYIYQRRWTLAEIMTAVAQSGLRLVQLDEHPNEKRHDMGIPKLFTLVAEKS